ncbi:MAG: DoxX family protein [Nanoarchaeota archaeon]
MIKKFLENNSDYFYFVFRVMVGLLFLLHGLQKMPGIINGTTPLIGLMGLAFIIETFGGALIILGLFTRYVSIITAIEMLVAYFMMHAKNGINPLVNKGELALLYFAAFLVIIAYGSKKWSIDNLIKK